MNYELPEFTYHPNPMATGSVEKSQAECICCGVERGYIYTGPVYSIAREELDDRLCPWCIQDGSAHDKFNASFTDEDWLKHYGLQHSVPVQIIEEVAYRTPSFSGWQQEQWWFHCNDAAIFLGTFGYAELQPYGEDGIRVIADDSGLEGHELYEFIKAFHKENGPMAYLFRCRHCGKLGGYQDCH